MAVFVAGASQELAFCGHATGTAERANRARTDRRSYNLYALRTGDSAFCEDSLDGALDLSRKHGV